MMCCPFNFGHPNETGVELTTLNKRLLGGNPILFLVFFIMLCIFHIRDFGHIAPTKSENRSQISLSETVITR